MKLNNPLKLLISLAFCQGAGIVGSIFTVPSVATWYAGVTKPDTCFWPPNWLFAPVWIVLFFLMGISLFLVWKRGAENKNVLQALIFFDIQLALNVLWSFLFFGLQNPFLALIEILVLFVAIFIVLLKFYKISKVAGWLLVPYLLWVAFASYLNYSIWLLN